MEPCPDKPKQHSRATDLQPLIDSGMGEILSQLIEIFLETAPRTIQAASCALREARPVELAHAAHDLNGSCSNMGAARLRELCRELEKLAYSNSLPSASQMLALVEEEYARVRAELLAHLDQNR